jgi:hypothetical protein
MKIAGRVSNTSSGHSVEVETEGRGQSIPIAAKNVGRGSSINGASYRSPLSQRASATTSIVRRLSAALLLNEVKVEVTGTFGNPGEPARDISCRVEVRTEAPQAEIDDLIRTTEAVTEIQNTVRGGAVRLEEA